MQNHPSEKPLFACTHCTRTMCRDCLSMAAEFEFLNASRALALVDAEEQIRQLKRELELAQDSQRVWEQIAKTGHATVVRMFLDSEVWQRVLKPHPVKVKKHLLRLEEDIRRVLEKRGDRP